MARKEFTPRPYQRQITEYIASNERCQVWAGMGLGKTVSTLNAIDLLMLTGDVRKVLILAPLRVARSTWPDEVSKWQHLVHLSVIPIVGDAKERIAALNTEADIYATNYEQLPWLVEYLYGRWPFDMVIADESTKLKGYRTRQGTKRAKALAVVAHQEVKRFVCLTGTPSPNGLLDLWGPQWFVDKGARLGKSYSAFRDRWFQISYDGFSFTPMEHTQEQVQQAMEGVCLSIDPKDHFDLKEPVVNNIYVDLPPAARKLYREMEKEMFVQLAEHDIEALNAASKTIKCLQLSSGSLYLDDKGNWSEVHRAKLDALEDVIEEAAGMPVLVAYHFKSDLARLLKAFPQAKQLDADPKTIRDWNAGKIPILLCHPASAGHGLNLQDGGNILVFFSHDWNLENRLQIIERIGPVRQMQAGHNRPMFIHNIISRNTVDEMVIERVETKRSVQDILLEAMKRRTG